MASGATKNQWTNNKHIVFNELKVAEMCNFNGTFLMVHFAGDEWNAYCVSKHFYNKMRLVNQPNDAL